MNSLDVINSHNIIDYFPNQEESKDKSYLNKIQENGKELRREYKQTREVGAQVDSNYLLN